MTLNEALILSYIKRGVGYGYSILTHIRENRSDEWIEFSRAGVYKILDKLAKSGLVNMAHKQVNGRPPRKVYTITDTGETALEQFLAHEFALDYVTRDDFNAYLMTAAAAVPAPGTLSQTVRRRMEVIRDQLDALKTEWPADTDRYLFIVYALYRRRLHALKEELDWLGWLDRHLDGISGDVLHMNWGEVRAALT